VARLATDKHLALRSAEGSGAVAETLFNKGSGLAEVVIPTRSQMIGQTAFPGMSARNGDLMVLAVHRGGQDLGATPTTLAAGDHLLMQGTWQALDKHLADPQLMVVDSPEVVRRQAIPLGHRAWEAIAVLVALVVLLVGNWFPAALVAVICAVALVLLRLLTVPQAYKGIDWNTCILVGGGRPRRLQVRRLLEVRPSDRPLVAGRCGLRHTALLEILGHRFFRVFRHQRSAAHLRMMDSG